MIERQRFRSGNASLRMRAIVNPMISFRATDFPEPLAPSTIDFATAQAPGQWFQPRWPQVWFPDAFAGTMAQLLCALEEDSEPEIGGADNLKTMALVEACYESAREHRAIEPDMSK